MKYIFYRPIMKLAHKFNWHYAPIIGPLEDGAYQRWCKWCGFRDWYIPLDKIPALRQAVVAAREGTRKGE